MTPVIGGGFAAMPMSFSTGGNFLAVKNATEAVDILELPSQKVLYTLRRPSTHLKNLRYNHDGSHLATSCADGMIIVWNIKSRRIVYEMRGHDGEATCLDFSPDGRFRPGGVDQSIRVWSMRNGRERVVYRGHTFGVRCGVQPGWISDRFGRAGRRDQVLGM